MTISYDLAATLCQVCYSGKWKHSIQLCSVFDWVWVGHHKSYKCGGIFSFLLKVLLLQQRTDSVESFDFTDPPIASKRKTQSRSQSEFDDEL